MSEKELVSTESVVAEIDASLARLNEAHDLWSWHGDAARIHRMAERLEGGALRPVVRHVWNRLLIHAVLGTALPPAARPKPGAQVAGGAAVPTGMVTFKDTVAALAGLWKARDYIKASLELQKAMREFQESTVALNHYTFLIDLLRDWTTPERYHQYEERLSRFSKEADKYKRLPAIVRALRKPPTPPEEPQD